MQVEKLRFSLSVFIGVAVVGSLVYGVAANATWVTTTLRAGSSRHDAPPPLAFSAVSLSELTEDRPILGNPTAQTTVIVFGDYQCSPCAHASPTLERAVQESGGQLRLVYQHCPLPSHPDALTAAYVAEHAASGGDFWDTHQKLYAALGATDNEQRRAATNDPAARKRVSRGTEMARRLGIRSTPTVIIYETSKPPRQTSADEVAYAYGVNTFAR